MNKQQNKKIYIYKLTGLFLLFLVLGFFLQLIFIEKIKEKPRKYFQRISTAIEANSNFDHNYILANFKDVSSVSGLENITQDDLARIIIRDTKPSDIRSIVEIYNKGLKKGVWCDVPYKTSVWTMLKEYKNFKDKYGEGNIYTRVLELDGKIAAVTVGVKDQGKAVGLFTFINTDISEKLWSEIMINISVSFLELAKSLDLEKVEVRIQKGVWMEGFIRDVLKAKNVSGTIWEIDRDANLNRTWTEEDYAYDNDAVRNREGQVGDKGVGQYPEKKIEIDGEIINQTENTDTYEKKDGTRELLIYPSQENIKIDGEWMKINDYLKKPEEVLENKTKKEKQYKLEPFNVYVGADKENKNIIKYVKDGDEISFSLRDISYKDENKSILLANAKIENISHSYKATTFKNIFEGVDLKYHSTKNGIKEEVFFNDLDLFKSINEPDYFNGKVVVRTKINVPTGITAEMQNDQVYFRKNNQIIFSTSQPFILDQEKRTAQVGSELKKENDEYYLEITLDYGWMTSDEKVFPLVLDPDLNLNPSADVSLCSDSTCAVNSGTGKVYIKFDVSGIPDGVKLNSANLVLTHASNVATALNARRFIDQSWNESSAVSTFTGGSYGSILSTITSGAGTTETWNVLGNYNDGLIKDYRDGNSYYSVYLDNGVAFTPAYVQNGTVLTLNYAADKVVVSDTYYSREGTTPPILQINYTPTSYTLTYNTSTNGSVSGTTPQTIHEYESGTAVTANPDPGYAFSGWSDGSKMNPRIDSNVSADVNVTASFELMPDIISVDAGPSSSDRTSLISNSWINYSETGSDDQISFSWTDPNSVSDDEFFYDLNSAATNTIGDDFVSEQNPNFSAFSAWSNSKTIIIDHTKVGATLTNFPVYINLADLDDEFFSTVKTNGFDIRVVNSFGTELPYELVSIDTTAKTGELHFKADSLSSTADTVFYIYFGNASATAYAPADPYGRNNVWDSNYKMVQHMSDLTTATTDDSTLNNFDGTKAGADQPIKNISGKIGEAQTFDGVNDYIGMPAGLSVPMGAVNYVGSIEFWAKNGSGTPIGIYRSDTNQGGYAYIVLSGGQFYYTNCDLTVTPYCTNIISSSIFTSNNWNHFVFTSNGSGQYQLAVNGVVTSINHIFNTTVGSFNQVKIGWTHNYTWGDSYFSGSIDDIKISNSVRSAEWIATEYANQNSPSTFYYFGYPNVVTPYIDDVIIPEGTNYFHVRPKTGNGVWGEERIFTVKYDKTNPIVSADKASETWYTENQTITLSTNDATSGISEARYVWDSNELSPDCSSMGTTFTNGNQITLSENGEHVLYLCSIDNVGNVATWNGNYKLDNIIPDIVAVDAGASSSDRTSLISGTWFNASAIGSDDQTSFSWIDPNSFSDDEFYYALNSIDVAMISTVETSTTNFSYTGTVQSYTVPAGVTSLTITAKGAGGGTPNNGGYQSAGGSGGLSTGTLSVTPGATYYFLIGGAGGNASGSGGFGGGGTGAAIAGGGGGGGGMSWFSTASTFSQGSVILVAGGGGGGSPYESPGGTNPGGNGGGLSGLASPFTYVNGGGGTQTAGGTGAPNGGYGYGTSGVAGIGGSSVSCTYGCAGGGGGGYFGGGGAGVAAYNYGSGGGGSGYISPILTNATTTQGTGAPASTNGSLTITTVGSPKTTDPYLDNIAISEGTSYMHVRPKTGNGILGEERIFTVKYDKTNSNGGSVSNYNGIQTSTIIPVIVNSGTDSLSGMSQNNSDYLLEYQVADYATTCGTYGAWTDANISEIYNATSYNFTGGNHKCYKFRYTTRDNASNATIYTGTDETIIDFIGHTVTFQDHDVNIIETQEVADGGSATAPTDPIRTGYTFTGWDVAFDNITSDLTVTAQYSINTYTITFNKNGGDTEADPVTKTANYNDTIETLPTAPTRTNYTFKEWNTNSDGSGTIFDTTTLVTDNLTVYAIWDEVISTPTPTPEITPTPTPEITPTPTPTPEITPTPEVTPTPEITPTPTPTPEITPTPTPTKEDNNDDDEEEKKELLIPKIKSIQGSCAAIKIEVSTQGEYENEKLDFKVKLLNTITNNEEIIDFKNIKTDKDGRTILTLSPLKRDSNYELKVKYREYDKDKEVDYSDWSDKEMGETSQCKIDIQEEFIEMNKEINKSLELEKIGVEKEKLEEFKKEAEKRDKRDRSEILSSLVYGVNNIRELIGENRFWISRVCLVVIILWIIWWWRRSKKWNE